MVLTPKVVQQAVVHKSIGQQLRQNLGWMLLGNLGSLAAGFITVAYLARVLGQAGFGTFSYAQTLGLYSALIVDLGFNVYGTRAVARHPTEAGQYLLAIASFQLVAGIVLLTVAGAIVYLANLWPHNQVRLLILTSLLWVVPFALNIEWFFLGFQKMHLVGCSRLIQNSSTLLLTYLLVKDPQHIILAPLARVAGGMLSALWLLSRVPKDIFEGVHLRIRDIVSHLAHSRWFWWSACLLQMSRSSDVIILQAYHPASEVGRYSAGSRLTAVATIAIGLINTVMFSMLSKEQTSNQRDFTKLLKLYIMMAALIGGVSLLVGLPGAPLIVETIYGKAYANTVSILRLLLIAGAVLVLQGAIEQPLLAHGRERSVFKIIAATGILSVTLNLLFIPQFGALGAAIVYLVCSCFSVMCLSFMYYRSLSPVLRGRVLD